MTSKPKVLMFIDWYQPGYKAGGPIRSCVNLVAHLSDCVEFFIVTGDRDYGDTKPYSDIRSEVWVSGRHGEQVMYVEHGRLTSTQIEQLFESEPFTHIYIHGLFSKYFSILPLITLQKRGTPIIVAPRGMLRHSALSIKAWKKKPFLKLAKILGRYEGVTFHATDELEIKDIKHWISKGAMVHNAPNLHSKAKTDFIALEKKTGKLKLLFAGRIAPEKNLLYALQILKGIEACTIELSIYGADYNRQYKELCQQEINQFPPHISAVFKGTVDPNELEVVRAAHHFLFLPTRGENFGHVILESFMSGRPVIISNQTPWENLEREGVGFDIPLDDQTEFRRRISSCASLNQSDYDKMCNLSFEKYKSISQDASIVEASKALFLGRD